MAYRIDETQGAVALTAIEDTKRGYGLWRGEVLHPASDQAARAAESGAALLRTDAAANAFLDQFDRAHEPAGARRLRYTVAAVWHCRKRRLKAAADEASMYVGFGNPKNGKHRRHPLTATEEGIS
jgi:hypothetical protein